MTKPGALAQREKLEVHNDYQREYFSSRELPRMTVDSGPATPYVSRHVSAVVDAARLTAEDRVLDVGCGIGKYTVELYRRGFNAEGLDLTPALVAALHDVEPRIPATVADVSNPPQELLGRYSAAVGFMVLHHVADLNAAFAGLHSTLLPGGRIAFLEPNPYFLGYDAQIAFTPGMTFKGDGGIVRLRRKPIELILEGAGFRNVSIEKFGAFPLALANREAGARLEQRLESVPGWDGCKAFQVISAERD